MKHSPATETCFQNTAETYFSRICALLRSTPCSGGSPWTASLQPPPAAGIPTRVKMLHWAESERRLWTSGPGNWSFGMEVPRPCLSSGWQQGAARKYVGSHYTILSQQMPQPSSHSGKLCEEIRNYCTYYRLSTHFWASSACWKGMKYEYDYLKHMPFFYHTKEVYNFFLLTYWVICYRGLGILEQRDK